MLVRVKQLRGVLLRAQDGDVGSVEEILFDDENWAARYVVVETGAWLQSRKVLIAPCALGDLHVDEHKLDVNVTCAQVAASPSIETDAPLCRQMLTDYNGYYGWPSFSGSMGMLGAVVFPGLMFTTASGELRTSSGLADERSPERQQERRRGDIHLRSTNELTGYRVVEMDGHLGVVDDFVLDDESWMIRYLAVDVDDWWTGQKVLLPPRFVGGASWPDRTVSVDLTRDQLRDCPEWDPTQPIVHAFADEVTRYYAEVRPEKPERSVVTSF
jgi:sporulation protein YlmC with PRC-barrel domain